MAESETVTLTIDAGDEQDEVTLPRRLVEMLAEEGQSTTEVAGDLVLFSCAQRVHATVHHTDGETDPALEGVEETTMELFEDRFGMSFGEATGHGH
ncbi:hypothetical protein BRC86_07040 [Halobacteriales archaeon QS_3_64_16]|jgi:hypothetical protein|nr:MAG: hypothetical protein BRC86_07040 [Halobacteriales archaeon QS_3_64_16]